MKRKNSLRDAVYAQVVWAIHELGLDNEYEMPVSTLKIRKKSTGQIIFFTGCDDPHKSKGLKPPFGFIGFLWFEEADQFKGMSEIRTVRQSAARGGERTFVVYTYNPPRTRDNWANREADRRRDSGEEVFDSCYLDAPLEWLGSQFIADAEDLKETDEQAYRHEYLGEPVGYGGQIFDRVEFREVTDKEIASFERLHAGQDFGWFPDPVGIHALRVATRQAYHRHVCRAWRQQGATDRSSRTYQGRSYMERRQNARQLLEGKTCLSPSARSVR